MIKYVNNNHIGFYDQLRACQDITLVHVLLYRVDFGSAFQGSDLEPGIDI